MFSDKFKEIEKKTLPPPPLVVFRSKLEVCQSNCDEGSDYDEDKEDDRQNTIDGVYSVTPNTGKYVVKLNVDGTERQKTSHSHLRKCSPVPAQWWDLSWIFCGTARS